MLEPIRHRLHLPVATNPLATYKGKIERQKCDDKLQEANKFDSSIGVICSVSGWRSRCLDPSVYDPLALVDWALIKISDSQLFNAVNYISTFGTRLAHEFPEGVPCWRSDGKTQVDKIMPIPTHSTMVFKQGRTTGLTGGVIGSLLPAAIRTRAMPGHLHHLCFVVFPVNGRRFFCRPGDSGSWCLNEDGEVIAMIIGGDDGDGTRFVTPFFSIVEDMVMVLGVDAASIKPA